MVSRSTLCRTASRSPCAVRRLHASHEQRQRRNMGGVRSGALRATLDSEQHVSAASRNVRDAGEGLQHHRHRAGDARGSRRAIATARQGQPRQRRRHPRDRRKLTIRDCEFRGRGRRSRWSEHNGYRCSPGRTASPTSSGPNSIMLRRIASSRTRLTSPSSAACRQASRRASATSIATAATSRSAIPGARAMARCAATSPCTASPAAPQAAATPRCWIC